MSKNEIHIWTDGSSVATGVDSGLGGYGAVLLYGSFKGVDTSEEYCDAEKTLKIFKGCTETTNQREEMKGVIESLKRVKDYTLPISIYSDSAYVINCMNQKWYVNWRSNGWKNSAKKDVKNKDLWEELLQVIEDNFIKIKFNKVKGHSGMFYNEVADDLAGMALKQMREERLT